MGGARSQSVTRRGCFLALLAALSVVLGVAVVGLRLGYLLDETSAPSAADAIVVLGGDGNFHRTRQAVELWQQGYAPLVVFSLGPAELELVDAPERTTREVAGRLGLRADAELFAGGATSTYDEAVLLRDLSNRRAWHALLIVTDSYHTRRATQTFRALLPGVRVMTVAAPSPTYDSDRWWTTEEGLTGVLNETVKLGFYWARYGIPPL